VLTLVPTLNRKNFITTQQTPLYLSFLNYLERLHDSGPIWPPRAEVVRDSVISVTFVFSRSGNDVIADDFCAREGTFMYEEKWLIRGT
jgi:hypothetical protein